MGLMTSALLGSDANSMRKKFIKDLTVLGRGWGGALDFLLGRVIGLTAFQFGITLLSHQ